VLAQLDELPPEDRRCRGLDDPVARAGVDGAVEAQARPRVDEELRRLAVRDAVRHHNDVTRLDRDELLEEGCVMRKKGSASIWVYR
jgi:hypothetical protein